MNYPLEYKHKFRSVIAGELDRSPDLKRYFDHWGSRCYAFSSELGANYKELATDKIELLDFNYGLLREMGANYTISAIEINQSKNEELQLLKKFEQPETPVKLYLYEVK